ncbi:MAG: hypothetical protein MUD12_12095 [Spirochaetes bacterium]|nr:hypothetical protein [Spirochaetota bacterium]
MKKAIVFAVALFMISVGLFSGRIVKASSSDAWEEFGINVKKACIKLAPPELKKPSIAVDEYGSESYGIAVLQGVRDGVFVSYVCVYDKKSEKAELSGAIDLKKAKKFKK